MGGDLNESFHERWHNAGPIVKIREVGRAACLVEYSPEHQEIFARAETTVNRHTCHFKTQSTYQIMALLSKQMSFALETQLTRKAALKWAERKYGKHGCIFGYTEIIFQKMFTNQ